MVWVGYHDNPKSMVALTHLPEVSSFEVAQEFLDNDMFNVNLIFATIDGHIGYQMLGSYPLRVNNDYGNFVKDGTTTAFDWIGLLPAKDRLQKIDPENGYIVTANNKIASE